MRTTLVVVLSLALLGLLEGATRDCATCRSAGAASSAGACRPAAGPSPLDSVLLRQGRFATMPALDAWLSAPALGAAAGAPPRAGRLPHDRGAALRLLAARSRRGALSSLWLGLARRTGGGRRRRSPRPSPLLLVQARERRSRQLSEQLPEALDMMARSLRAGHALSSAFQLVADGDAGAHLHRVRPGLRGAAPGDAARAGGSGDGGARALERRPQDLRGLHDDPEGDRRQPRRDPRRDRRDGPGPLPLLREAPGPHRRGARLGMVRGLMPIGSPRSWSSPRRTTWSGSSTTRSGA